MAAVTLFDLKNRVAQKLGLTIVGQDVNADDGATIGQMLTDLEEQMSILNVGFFNFANGIETAYAEPVSLMCAAHLVDEFGVPEPKKSQLFAAGRLGLPGRSLAERQIRLLSGIPGKPATTVDFTPP